MDFLNINMFRNSMMVGLMYCMNLSVDSDICVVVWVKNNSGSVVIMLERSRLMNIDEDSVYVVDFFMSVK